MKNDIKLGHQAPRGQRQRNFNSIELMGDFAYCKSHNFIYNVEVEEEKLYNGQACYYTDKRFIDGKHNYFKETYLHWTRFKAISLKACIRKTLNCRNIPINTIVKFGTSWYNVGKKIDTCYLFKIKKENNLDIEYEISKYSFSNNFMTHSKSKKLTDKLRENGFIVQVINKEGEYAIAFGYGKKIGFSSKNNTFMGYSNGCDNILWNKFGEFDKWSRCNEISKDTNIEEIINVLKK